MKRINLYLVLLLLILFIMICSVNKYETYKVSLASAAPLKHSSSSFKLNNNDDDNTNNKLEQFYDTYHGYHGKFGNSLPFATSNIPQSLPQKKQILNQLVYNYPSIYDDPYRYPNVVLPPQVIGCGGRRGACMGGSQVPIPNTLPPVNISGANIAPINLTMRGFDEGIQQVGTIQKVFGSDNFVYPLFGRKKYRNDNKWEYFVKFGKYGVILPLVPLRNYDELNTNDEVFIQGQKGKYRVTMYDDDIPQYLPYT